MKFSEEEQKMIKHLRQQHDGWKITRVIILVSSLILLAYSVFDISHANQTISACIMLGAAVWGLSYSLGGWAGRPEVSLLLKIVESHEKI